MRVGSVHQEVLGAGLRAVGAVRLQVLGGTQTGAVEVCQNEPAAEGPKEERRKENFRPRSPLSRSEGGAPGPSFLGKSVGR